MASFNRVILAGNLTRDPQLSYTPSNTPVCEFGMAINRRRKDKDGNTKEEVCYVDLTSYGRTAETINQYMNKGQPVLVEGRLRYNQWTNKEGQKRNKLDVVVENFTFLGTGRGADTKSAQPAGQGGGPAPGNEQPLEDADIPF